MLLTLDEDLAREAQAAGCRTCGGRLHSARYPRKPRGGPEDLGPDYAWRLSFCCAQDGCRRRTTPPSVRYLGRRVYLGAVVWSWSPPCRPGSRRLAQRLHAWLGVSMRTLQRWRAWWRTTFVTTAFWRAVQGRFLPPVPVGGLPASLRDRFHGPDERSQLMRLLRFLCPLTTASVSLGASLAMAAEDPQTMHLVSPSPRA